MITFDHPDPAPALDRADAATLDALDFGVVRLDEKGVVRFYNRYESNLSGLSSGDVVEKNFFLEVAPCTNNFMVALKYERAGPVDELVPYVFSFRMKPTAVTLRLLRGEGSPWSYLLVRRS